MHRNALSQLTGGHIALASRGALQQVGSLGILLLLSSGCIEKWQGEDADGDGVSVADGDCWDDPAGPSGSGLTGADINPGVDTDVPYDGVDQDCAGNDDYDLDGDGYVTDADHLGRTTTGVVGSGSDHIGAGDCLDDPAAAAPSDNDLPAISAAEIFPGADDSWYDGVDQNCREDDDYDADLDGDRALEWSDGTDCDDEDPVRAGTFQEVCDPESIDEDCDDLVNSADDSVDPTTVFDYFTDADDDGYGDPADGAIGCELPAGSVANNLDCDDTRDDVNPDADEVCDAADVDEDCDDNSDDDDDSVVYGPGDRAWTDSDGDGYGDPAAEVDACDLSGNLVANDQDCDDGEAAVNPTATEVCDGGVDNDCANGADDADPAVDLSTGTEFYRDSDSDSFGDADNSTRACAAPSGYVADATDCDDTRSSVNPSETEVCNDRDDDCDTFIDDDDSSVSYTASDLWYADTDRDNFGDAASSTSACDAPAGHVRDDTDCDDDSAAINTDATEICDDDDTDEDCDGQSDDDDPSVSAATYLEYYADTDGDGFGDAASTIDSCDPSSGYTDDDTDCDDTDSAIKPGGTEICDADDTDEDCDGQSDDDDSSVDTSTYNEFYADTDGDTYGDAASTLAACDLPATGYSTIATDCDDGEADSYPGAPETCNDFVDSDCDETTCLLESESLEDGADLVWRGDGNNIQFGYRVVMSPDLNGDGIADPLVSAPLDNPPRPSGSSAPFFSNGGVVRIGASTSGLALDAGSDLEMSASGAAIYGENAAVRLGQSMVGGDFDNDGNNDLIIGSVLADPSGAANGGKAYFIAGPISSSAVIELASDEQDAEIGGITEDDYLGWFAAAGNTNGDSAADLAVSAPQCGAASTGISVSATGAGIVYLLEGSTGTSWFDNTSPDLELTGLASAGCAGLALVFGDVDGNGTDELLVGEPKAGTGGGVYFVDASQTGSVALSAEPKVDGTSTGEYAGAALASADLDGDGYDDAIIGAPYTSSYDGAVYVLHGSASGIGAVGGGVGYDLASQATATLTPPSSSGGQLGISLASAGDLDQDGEIDLLIGAWVDDTTANNSGAAWVVYGPFSGGVTLSPSTDARFTGMDSSEGAGLSVAGGEDLTNDGFPDLLIGGYGASDATSSSNGAAYLVMGRGN